VGDAQEEARRLVGDAEERLEALRDERDEVASYLEGLRTALGGASAGAEQPGTTE